MSNIVVQEFDVCHKFVLKINRSISLDQSPKCEITHNVACDEFSIFIGFTQAQFDIDALIANIVEDIKKSNLYQHGWKVHRPLVQR